MASAINNGTFTFNTEELQDLSEIIHELIYDNPELRALHDIQEGIAWNKQIVFAGRMGLMGKATTGCTPNAVTGITLTEKKWEPVEEDFRLQHCSVDVNDQDKLIQQMARMNPDFYNVIEGSQSDVGQFLIAKVIEGFQENLLRKVWFSDKAADTVDNSGTLTNGTDKGFFNTFDGLFKQMLTNIPTTGSGSEYYVAIAKNAGANYTAQELATNDGINTLRAMYKKADQRLRSNPDARFYVTQSLWDQYSDDLEDIQNTGGGNTSITENGQVRLTFKGIELIPMHTWDRNISAYYDNGTKWDKPHRAVLTTRFNIPIGTVAESDFGEIDAFYDKVTKQNYIDGIYKIDSKHLENYLTVFAY